MGSGREYTLNYSVLDASGNGGGAAATTTVPLDLGSGPEPILLMVLPGVDQGTVQILWDAVSDAAGYDVITGDLGGTTFSGNTLLLGPTVVVGRGLLEPTWFEVSGDPETSPGTIRFYLVQFHDSRGGTGFGTESAPWPREPTSCEGGCP